MSFDVRAHFDAVYEKETALAPVVSYLSQELAIILKPGARILDLGCGDGRDAVYLAFRGFDVTAVDISEKGIEKTRERARKYGVKVNAVIGDTRDVGLIDSFGVCDAVFGYNLLQFLTPEEIRSLLPFLKAKTEPGGANAFGYLAIADYYTEKPVPHGFTERDFRNSYKDWDEVYFSEGVVQDVELPENLKKIWHTAIIVVKPR